jgi:hypothetical protein
MQHTIDSIFIGPPCVLAQWFGVGVDEAVSWLSDFSDYSGGTASASNRLPRDFDDAIVGRCDDTR